jgi:alkylhydroperoxidase family enzyme
MLAHGAVLRSKFFPPEQVEAMARDYRSAGLEPVDVAVMAFAEKIALHAYKVTPDDIAALRRHGLSDTDVLDVALTAAARCFFSKLLDAIGAEPDAEYLDLEDSLRRTLTVGRPFGP